MTPQEIDDLWLDVEFAGGPREPLVTMAEARAITALLQQMGQGDDEAAALARHVAGRVARRLPAED